METRRAAMQMLSPQRKSIPTLSNKAVSLAKLQSLRLGSVALLAMRIVAPGVTYFAGVAFGAWGVGG
jgi:hypothetical protein